MHWGMSQLTTKQKPSRNTSSCTHLFLLRIFRFISSTVRLGTTSNTTVLSSAVLTYTWLVCSSCFSLSRSSLLVLLSLQSFHCLTPVRILVTSSQPSRDHNLLSLDDFLDGRQLWPFNSLRPHQRSHRYSSWPESTKSRLSSPRPRSFGFHF